MDLLVEWEPIAVIDVRVGGTIDFRHTTDTIPDWATATPIGDSLPGTARSTFLPNQDGGTYLVRVTDASGRQSDVTQFTEDLIAPGNVTNLAAVALPSGLYITWTNPSDDDFWHVEVYGGTVNPPTDLVAMAPGDTLPWLGLNAETEYFIRARAIDFAGNEGAYTAVISRETLAAGEAGMVDTSTPDAPDVTLTPGGQQGRGYVILVTVERASDAGEGGIRETQIQIGTSSTGFTAASRACGSLTGSRAGRAGRCGSDTALAGVGR